MIMNLQQLLFAANSPYLSNKSNRSNCSVPYAERSWKLKASCHRCALQQSSDDLTDWVSMLRYKQQSSGLRRWRQESTANAPHNCTLTSCQFFVDDENLFGETISWESRSLNHLGCLRLCTACNLSKQPEAAKKHVTDIYGPNPSSKNK